MANAVANCAPGRPNEARDAAQLAEPSRASAEAPAQVVSAAASSGQHEPDSSNSRPAKKAKTKKKTQKEEEKKKKKKMDDADKRKAPAEQPARDLRADQPKTRSLVEELKLFQNNTLLNQQDPLQLLHRQLDQLIRDDSIDEPAGHKQSALDKPQATDDNHAGPMQSSHLLALRPGHTEDAAENIFTVKKGVLWQQQHFDKFHQRLFSRWKKRYFILTTDYLVCFKRSAPKVGRSEMGKFLYKTSLGEIRRLEWLKPKKSDKGAIVLSVAGQFELHLWCKSNLDEWMELLAESINRHKTRRAQLARQQPNGLRATQIAADQLTCDELYANQDSFNIPPKGSASTRGSQEQEPRSSLASSNRATRTSSRDEAESRQSRDADGGDASKVDKSSPSENGDQRQIMINGPAEVPGQVQVAEAENSSCRSIGSERRNQEAGRADLSAVPLSQRPPKAAVRSTKLLNGGINCPARAQDETRAPSSRPEDRQPQSDASSSSSKRLARERRELCDTEASKPTSNLIRRDDSWQSLVSLTRVGKQTPVSAQAVAQRSLYAQHIAPGEQAARRYNLESTVTPLRGPLLRQQSAAAASPRALRASPASERQAASFELAPDSPSLAANQRPNQRATSYYQKLLQLQLMHNSNNVDYIRANGDAANCADYQIYGPDSTANHYGYYSMRSNLKSAASEFSFIRPSSSALGNQSTLPHQPNQLLLDSLNTQRLMGPVGSPPQQQQARDRAAGYLAAPSQLVAGPESGGAPTRELPLKPNKRRGPQREPALEQQPRGQSLTSSIVCFFRRAFSRRSRRGRKRRSELAGSCSSSLGAFDASFVPLAPSAFSTGSKSAADRANQQHQRQPQPQRMVDMIEAFASKTAMAASEAADGRLYASHDVASPPPLPSAGPKLRHLNQFGSPLHKSNSVSATMGAADGSASTRRSLLYDNELLQAGGSPLMMRSSKVMSANLTPMMGQRDSSGAGHLLASPRNARPDLLPRPSSIYGQPSMISSPVVGRHEFERQFGAHRGSLHAGQRPYGAGRDPLVAGCRPGQMKMGALFPLDSTRELSEELASPTGQSPAVFDYDRRDNCQPGARLHHRQAIVNPILQSPTMDTIYDNYPMALESPSYSHYDNHNQLVTEPQRDLHQAHSSPIVSRDRQLRLLSSSSSSYNNTPSHQRSQLSTVGDMLVGAGRKPAAVVAPTTPNRSHYGDGLRSSDFRSSPIFEHPKQQLMMAQQSAARSPIASRRVSDQSHYLQSPLVSHQTRLVNKGDGIQATILAEPNRSGRQVVNIAGAPGISLEPSLAASLLRGTNIDAYESMPAAQGAGHSNSKTFLVATRLSKSMAHSSADTNNNSPEEEPTNGTGHSRSSKGTDSSAISSPCPARAGNSSSQDEQPDEGPNSNGARANNRSRKSSDAGSSLASGSSRAVGSGSCSSRKSSVKRRGSSQESDVELTNGSRSGSLDEPEEARNWITSKLVE